MSQSIALSMPWKRELLYGGAAGGGKTYFVLMSALQYVDWPEYRALIIRRTFPQLQVAEGLLATAQDWLAGQAKSVKSMDGHPTRWIFPSGAQLHFGHVQHLKDRYNYQGGAYHFLGADELTQFLESQYTYIAFSRQRRTVDSRIPIRVRATSNPGGEGHEWVRQRFIEEADRIEPGREEAYFADRRAFLPARIDQNPYLDRDAYEDDLQHLHPYERAMLMQGDWDVRPPGALFQREWWGDPWSRTPGRVLRRVRYWDLAATDPSKRAGSDPDWSVGTLGAKLADAPIDLCIEDVESHRLEPGPLERRIVAIARSDGPEVEQVIEQEPGSSGKIASQALGRALEGYRVRFRRPTGAKIERAGPLASAAEQGRVGVRRGPWLGEWLRHMEQFPHGSHDDHADSASGCYSELCVTGGVSWADLYGDSPQSSELPAG